MKPVFLALIAIGSVAITAWWASSGQPSDIGSALFDEWPIELSYTLSYQDTPTDSGSGLVDATFSFSGTSWSDWSVLQLTGPGEGWTMQVRPDGTVWAGYDGPQSLFLLEQNEAGFEATPHADFAVVWHQLGGGSVDDLVERAGFEPYPAPEASVSDILGIPPQRLAGYRIQETGDDGLLTESIVVVEVSSRLPLLIEERLGGHLVRRLAVTHIEFNAAGR